MGCPQSETLQDLIDGRLSPAAHAELLTHTEHCASCRELVVSLLRSGEPATPSRIRPERGSTIERFIVIEEIGAGSMGVVFSAYDPRLDRKVAIKLVRPGTENATKMRARLVNEAHAMAKLSHPAVVTVYEVGSIGEQVFVVMEFVDGGTLSSWLRAERRPWPEIVSQFAWVGSGLAAAHRAGLVHRDFKPDNVLVGSDGRGRVTDFGLVGVPATPSRPAAAPPIEVSLTQSGTAVGTPLYMAPEQHRRETVDARADQFAFCVALYEALYGARPFAAEQYSTLVDDVVHGRVREPPRDARVPARLRRIVLRGLHPAPDQRYPSMEALLADLSHDPSRTRSRAALVATSVALAAALAGWGGYAGWHARTAERQLCDGAQRNLVGVWDADLKQRVHHSFLATAQPYAEAAWSSVSRRLDDYSSAWVRMHTDACQATRRGEQSERALDLRMTCLGRRRSELAALTELFANADATTVEKSVSAAASLTDLSGCADVERLATPMPLPEDPAARGQVDLARAKIAVAEANREAGRYAAALTLAEPALAIARRSGYQPALAEALLVTGRLHSLVGDAKLAESMLFAAVVAAATARHDEVEADARTELVRVAGVDLARFEEGLRSAVLASAILGRLHDDPVRLAALLRAKGAVLAVKGSYEEARADYTRALELEQKLRQPAPLRIASSLVSVGNSEYSLDRYEEALAYYRRAVAIQMEEQGPEHPDLVGVFRNMGAALAERGDLKAALEYDQRALAIVERSLGADHPSAAGLRGNLGVVSLRNGDYDVAAGYFRRALEIATKSQPGHPDIARYHIGLAEVELGRGRYDEALQEYRRALAIQEKTVGPQHDDVARSHRGIGNVYVAQGNETAALASYRRALAIFETALGAESFEAARSMADVATILSRIGHHAEAIAQLTRAGAILEKTVGANHESVADNHRYLGEALARSGRSAEAIEHFERALAIIERVSGPTHETTASALLDLGMVQLAVGRAAAAVQSLERAVAIFTARAGDPRNLGEARFALARALWASRADRARAVALAGAARASFAAGGDAGREQARVAKAWLAQHATR
jgi:tetratricopeptide (TPR) repeat protein